MDLFVKPARQGSSVGVSRAKTSKELTAALAEAFKFDQKVLVEKRIDGREIECAILGNQTPKASEIGEIIPKEEGYTYEAKYIDSNSASLIISPKLENKIKSNIQELALRTYQVLNCRGMARVDMFLLKDNSIMVNEVNTIPGFTNISMYPKLWEASGLNYTELIDQLIQLALEP